MQKKKMRELFTTQQPTGPKKPEGEDLFTKIVNEIKTRKLPTEIVKLKGSFRKIMFRSFLRNFSEAFKRAPKMSSRYFPNPNPDFEPEFGMPHVPNEQVQNFIDLLISDIEKYFPPVEKNGAEGVYLGTAGVSYMFYHLSKLSALNHQKEMYLSKALDYIKPAIIVSQLAKKKADIPSFILGHSGVFAVASAVFYAVGDVNQSKNFREQFYKAADICKNPNFLTCGSDELFVGRAVASAVFYAVGDVNQSKNFREQFYKAADICKNPNFLTCGSDELFVGRAGYILGALWMAKATGTPLRTNDLHELCKVTVKSGKDYAAQHRCPCPLMYSYYQIEYLGAAHGLCSILLAILCVPGFLDANPTEALDVKESIDWLLRLQTPDGNFPAATDEIGHESRLVHWCHGAGGIFYLMAKAYLVFQDKKYLDSCKKMANLIWERGLLKKGPGLCHGVGGNGYVFLIMFRLTGESQYLYRAMKFFDFMLSDTFKTEARKPDCPYSLYEGTAGTVCYLGDLLCPSQAQFPFSDIF